MTVSPTLTARGVKSRLKRRNVKSLRAAFKNSTGAIDLASIMVGVLVIGIIGGVIAATVFAVLPWSQDEAAKATLGSVRTAEAAFFAANGSASYGDLSELQAPLFFSVGSGAPRQPAASVTAAGAPLLPASDQPLTVIANSNGWAAAATSAAGVIYYASSGDITVSTAVPAVLPDGLDPTALTGAAEGETPVYTSASQTVQISRVSLADGSLPVWMISVTSILASDSPYNAALTPPKLPLLSAPDFTGIWGTDPLLNMSTTNGTIVLSDGSAFPLMDHSTLQGDFGVDGSHLRRVRMNMSVSGFGAFSPRWASVAEAEKAFVGAKVVFVQNGQTNTIEVEPDAEFGFPSP
ncbi:hypothetical protein ACVXZ4_08430 [Lacisediminihabitans sp. FW035]